MLQKLVELRQLQGEVMKNAFIFWSGYTDKEISALPNCMKYFYHAGHLRNYIQLYEKPEDSIVKSF